MQGGDIAIPVSQRILIIFDGFVAKPPSKPKEKAQYKLAVRLHNWRRAFDLWSIHPLGVAHLNDLHYRWSLRFDLVTWQPMQFAAEIERWVEAMNIPVAHVHYSTPEKLAREIAYMPDVVKVFDPDPSHRWRYGSRGRVVESVEQFSIFA